MNQIDFLELSTSNKLTELASNGNFLDFTVKGVYLVKLFQLHNFYVEIYHHIEKDRTDSIIAFNNTNKLAPYLNKIKIYLPPPHRRRRTNFSLVPSLKKE